MHAGCTIANFDGYNALFVGASATASLVNCTFAGNALFAANSGTAVIEADASDAAPARDTAVRLQGCTFLGNTPVDTFPTLLADNREASTKGVFYSDDDSAADSAGVCGYEGADQYSTVPACESSSPKGLATAGEFLNISSVWFVEVQEVCFQKNQKNRELVCLRVS